MYILGINAYHPDSSACIIKDGILIAAAEEERFNRIKHWAGFPSEAIRYCLQEANVKLSDIQYIALNRNPWVNLDKKIIFMLSHRISFSLLKNRLNNLINIKSIKKALSREFAIPQERLKLKIFHIEHHRAHCASAFFVSPFKKATVISVDGFGDFASVLVAEGIDNQIKYLYEINYPNSLGIFYTAFTQFLGFKNFGDEYKVMGLSAYGKPRYAEKLKNIIFLEPNGKFKLDLSYFSFYRNNNLMLWDNTAPKLEEVFSGRLIKEFGTPREYTQDISTYHCDLASSLQQVYEEVFFHILNYAYKLTGIKNLCLSGGCALNSLANGKIFKQTPFREIYIQPASSDAGGALGAVYYLYHQILKNKRVFLMEQAYWGPAFDNTEIKKTLEENKEELDKYFVKYIEDSGELCLNTAQFIAQGKIVGWFQGRMEWGPRALGNRSILVDPRRKEMKDILNARIKRREWFRPFAPSILEEKTKEYFEEDYPEPFMLKVYLVKEEKREVIPAVTHMDGTGRLQTVNKSQNPLFWQLIKEFEKLTGVAVLLNTSFNENEPIVCNPQQALDCFLRTKMDVLVLGNYLIAKEKV